MNTSCYAKTTIPTDGRQIFMSILKDDGYRTHGTRTCHFTPDKFALRGFETREIRKEDADSREDCSNADIRIGRA